MAKATRKKPATKVKPVNKREASKPQVIVETPPFHIVFPITLVLKKENKNCYFQCEYHLNSYIKRYNLKKTDYKVQDTAPKDPESSTT